MYAVYKPLGSNKIRKKKSHWKNTDIRNKKIIMNVSLHGYLTWNLHDCRNTSDPSLTHLQFKRSF